MTREEELRRAGWERRATYDEPRLSEMVSLYREIGFEVHLEPLEPADLTTCSECLRQNPDQFRTIYVRKEAAP
ncbi:MAG: hypothetical protein AB1486_05535 [Planctomycetota bacterium]